MSSEIARKPLGQWVLYVCVCARFLCLESVPAGAGGTASAQTPPALRSISHAEIEAKYATPESRFASIDDVRIHYKDQGSGPAILLIHGSFGDTADWDQWAAILRRRYRVIRFDLPGFGLSGEIENGNYAIDHSLALIDGLMDRLGVPRFAIAGVSYGGPVAFRYAATRTARVTALVIMNSAGIEFGKQTVYKKTGAKTFYNATTSQNAVTTSYVQTALSHSFQNPANMPPGFVQRKTDFLNVQDRNTEAARMIALYQRGDPVQVLAHVTAPTLVLWGGAERSLSQSTADDFAAALTHARPVEKVVVAGGDHYMHVELAAVTCGIVEKFLTTVLHRK